MPDATPEQATWFNELQRVSSSPENAARMLEGFFDLDGVGMALITKHKIITTGTTLIALLPAHKSVLDRVSMLTIFTSNHMPSLLSTALSMQREHTYLSGF